MPQRTAPFIEAKYGWNFGEGGWNVGMDENILKFAYLFDSNIDGIVDSLPAAVSGKAYYLSTDRRVYFSTGSSYVSTPIPKWFEVKIRSTGDSYIFNDVTLIPKTSIETVEQEILALQDSQEDLGLALDAKLDAPSLSPTSDGEVLTWNGDEYVWSPLSDIPQSSTITVYQTFPENPPMYQLFIVSDTIKPVVTAFSLQNNQFSPITITSFEATDSNSVTGWWLGETADTPSLVDSRWTSVKPTSYITSSLGSTTIYARVRDAAGNISDPAIQSVTILAGPYIDVGWPYNPSIHTGEPPGIVAGSITGAVSISYVPVSNAAIKNIQIPIKKLTSQFPGVGGITVTVRTGSSSGPSIASASVPSFTSITPETKVFSFSSPITLSTGTTYYFVLTITSGTNTGGDVAYRVNTNPNAANNVQTSLNGGPWVDQTGQAPFRLERN